MKGKLLILAVGVGVGFLLGSRAGRAPYEKFTAATKQFWEDPRVQKQVDRSVAFANDKVEDIAAIVSTGTKNIVHRMTAPKPARAKVPAKAPAKATAKAPAKSATTKSATTKSAAKSTTTKKAADGE